MSQFAHTAANTGIFGQSFNVQQVNALGFVFFSVLFAKIIVKICFQLYIAISKLSRTRIPKKMAKTRAAVRAARARHNEDENRKDFDDQIRQKSKELKNQRNARYRHESPRKRSATKQKLKAKRESLKFEQMLSNVKKNLFKVGVI